MAAAARMGTMTTKGRIWNLYSKNMMTLFNGACEKKSVNSIWKYMR